MRLDSNLLNLSVEHGIDFLSRRLWLHADIDEVSIGWVIRGMSSMSDLGDGPIELYVSSYGGELDESFALHDLMQMLEVEIHTVALGKCMSAAPLLVAAGAPGQRFAAKNTVFMLHNVAGCDVAADSHQNLKATADVIAKSVATYSGLLAEYTTQPKAHWSRIMRSNHDRYFDADQALEWGLIDGIL